jgi:hypothetical protein
MATGVWIELVGEGNKHHGFARLPPSCTCPPFVVWNGGIYQVTSDAPSSPSAASLLYRQVFALLVPTERG